MFNVNDMYTYSKTERLPLLSSFDAEFWDEYVENYADYDMLFRRLYKSFRYFDQECCSIEELSDVTERFINDVRLHLMANKKKYDELYRVHLLEDTEYSLTDNLNMSRTESETKNASGSYTSGMRQDSSNETIGDQENISEREVSAFDSSSYAPAEKTTDDIGEQQNTIQTTKGAQTDTNSNAEINSRTVTIKGKDTDKSMASLISSHIKLWDSYQFYTYIFMDIAKELLLV